jgi:hypothetical protein
MHIFKTLLGFGLAASATLFATRDASASFIDVGVQGGVVGRTPANVSYKPAFSFQAHADLALIPPILMVGAYVHGFPFGGTMYPKTDEGVITEGGDSITFRGAGLRAKLKIPIPGAFKPYALAGVGLTNANFPDYTVRKCAPGTTICAEQRVTNANNWFAEFVLGGGFMIDIAGPLALTFEGAWRPSTGYKNEQYDQAVDSAAANSGQPDTPTPSRTGYAWTFHGGLALSL